MILMSDERKYIRIRQFFKILIIIFLYNEKEREREMFNNFGIGIFQVFVGVVQVNMVVLEECVNKAEDEMGLLSGFKKMLFFFVGLVSW